MAQVIGKTTITKQLQGADGKSAVSYEIIPNPAVIKRKEGKSFSVNVTAEIYKIVGSTRTALTSSSAGTARYAFYDGTTKLTYGAGTFVPGGAFTTGLSAALTATDLRIQWWDTVNGTEKLMAEKSIPVVVDGEQGMPGMTRKPIRMLEWDKIVSSAFQFYAGDKETDLYSDVVWRTEGSGSNRKIAWYYCISNCTRGTASLPTGVMDAQGKVAFAAATQADFIATDLFLAQKAIIENLVTKELIAGEVVDGVAKGKRIEILPDKKTIFIYDENDKLCATFSGDKKTADSLKRSSAVWQNLTSGGRGDRDGNESPNANYDSGWVKGGTITAKDGGTTHVSCKLEAFAGNAYWHSANTTQDRSYFKEAYVTVEVRIVKTLKTDLDSQIYDSAEITAKSQGKIASFGTGGQGSSSEGPQPNTSQSREEDVTLTANLPKGATAYFEYRIRISYNEADNNEVRAWGKISAVTGSTASAKMYQADYFGNGMIISASNEDYMMCVYDEEDADVGFNFTAMSGGYGVRLTPQGLAIKTNPIDDWHYLGVQNGYVKAY